MKVRRRSTDHPPSFIRWRDTPPELAHETPPLDVALKVHCPICLTNLQVHSYDISDCTASGTITAAEADISKAEIGSLIGRAYRCTLAETAVSAVTLNGAKLGPVGVDMK